MIEVVLVGSGWTWRMIAADRRVLVYTSDSWHTDLEAFAAAKAYRTAFWAMACTIDHRMGACI